MSIKEDRGSTENKVGERMPYHAKKLSAASLLVVKKHQITHGARRVLSSRGVDNNTAISCLL